MFNFTFPIRIDFSSILSFLIGVFFGAIIILLIYVLLVLLSLHDKRYMVKTEEDSLQDSDVKRMVLEAQNTFKDKSLRGDLSKPAYCKNIVSDLALEIASRYYPNSKHPLLELSVDEIVILIGYIQKRIDDLLNRKGLRLLLRLKVSQIVALSKTTINVTSSKAFKTTVNANKKFQKVKKVLNVINPATWFRTLVINNTIGIIINKLCLIVIAIVGEETYKIYSKKVFQKEVDLETNVEELYNELDKEIIENKNSLEKENEESNKKEASDDMSLKRYPYVLSNNDLKYERNIDETISMLKRD